MAVTEFFVDFAGFGNNGDLVEVLVAEIVGTW
jgi:hypothetical protein